MTPEELAAIPCCERCLKPDIKEGRPQPEGFKTALCWAYLCPGCRGKIIDAVNAATETAGAAMRAVLKEINFTEHLLDPHPPYCLACRSDAALASSCGSLALKVIEAAKRWNAGCKHAPGHCGEAHKDCANWYDGCHCHEVELVAAVTAFEKGGA